MTIIYYLIRKSIPSIFIKFLFQLHYVTAEINECTHNRQTCINNFASRTLILPIEQNSYSNTNGNSPEYYYIPLHSINIKEAF